MDVRTAHTSELEEATLAGLRRFVEEAFVEFDAHDWEHALGGVHVIGRERDELVAHASVVQRRLFHRGRALRTGYVEAVAVRADSRRRGYGRSVMERVDQVIAGAYELGALAAGEDGAPSTAGAGGACGRATLGCSAPPVGSARRTTTTRSTFCRSWRTSISPATSYATGVRAPCGDRAPTGYGGAPPPARSANFA
jgi:aminoglycoside 2'-N-acetyltransferase I